MSILSYNWKSSKIIDASYSIFMGILSAGFILLIFYLLHTPKPIATVDVSSIINQFVKAQSVQKLSPEEQQARAKVFGEKLENSLHMLAMDREVVILPKEAVIAGAQDLSAEVESRIKTNP